MDEVDGCCPPHWETGRVHQEGLATASSLVSGEHPPRKHPITWTPSARTCGSIRPGKISERPVPGWDRPSTRGAGRIRTAEWRFCRPLPYHLATAPMKRGRWTVDHRLAPQSGKRDSNPRPQPWQGCALPTELFPHGPGGFQFGTRRGAGRSGLFLPERTMEARNPIRECQGIPTVYGVSPSPVPGLDLGPFRAVCSVPFPLSKAGWFPAPTP